MREYLLLHGPSSYIPYRDEPVCASGHDKVIPPGISSDWFCLHTIAPIFSQRSERQTFAARSMVVFIHGMEQTGQKRTYIPMDPVTTNHHTRMTLQHAQTCSDLCVCISTSIASLGPCPTEHSLRSCEHCLSEQWPSRRRTRASHTRAVLS